ncbi:MAG: glycosyltransferase [Actinomycetota bacterium]
MSVPAIAIVAARDEAERIAATVAALRSIPWVERVIVADDGSLDATGALAAAAGATVVRREGPGGKGAALRAGVAAARVAERYLLADGDLGDSASALADLAGALDAGDADVVVGVPIAAAPGGFGLVRRFAAAAIRLAGGPAMRAPLSGQRLLTADALRALEPFADGFGVETAMGIDAARAGLDVREVDVAVSHRATGRTPAGFLHRGRQGLHILRAAASRLARRRPR